MHSANGLSEIFLPYDFAFRRANSSGRHWPTGECLYLSSQMLIQIVRPHRDNHEMGVYGGQKLERVYSLMLNLLLTNLWV